MTSAKGYRLKVNSILELSALLDEYRAMSLKLLGKQYGSMVAKKSVEYLDRDRLGLNDLPEDTLTVACEDIRKKLGRNNNGILFPELNCCIRLHIIHDAVLATFSHGSPIYRKAWESNKNVVKWGWSANLPMPDNVSESNWKMREKYWNRINSKALPADLQFILIDRPLPNIGWGAIWRYLPTREERIAAGIEALYADDKTGVMRRSSTQSIKDLVSQKIDEEINKNSFIPISNTLKNSGAKRIREEIASKKPITKDTKEEAKAEIKPKLEEPKKKEKEFVSTKASSIDHADVIVASDNRIFVAVSYVGLNTESRVFIQVSDNHIVFAQNGVQYGVIDNVKRSHLDLLRSTKQVVLVEVEKIYEDRLLRAKHIAIVSDISLMDSPSPTITNIGYSNTPREEKELKEWERH